MNDGNRAAERRLLRQNLRERRRALPASERIAAANALADHLLALAFAPQSGYVAGYWALDGEIALHAWQLRLPRDCVYCLPVLGDDQHLRFAPWRPGNALVSNRFGIPEPDLSPSSLLEADAMSLVVMPLVGFDERGNRLGMGGGWYDRSFAFRHERSAPPYLVGAAFAVQQMPVFEAETWDVRLDAVCTEQRCFGFTSTAA
ncbi:5-formyltetrahydrofolate cyclo-ligase [Lysobacter sp. Root494]|uniref:5-formyltetrahydrofolate cyclo-ligase n=1 Tax=Lysobacter sp. Root494 TaxID=1736549 RepID=UPI0006F956CF|nr:5-formyltetrahydrofolate cyclo-ligase [Lysobacter sp. Root494]KQY49891.1 5-formyltetrahydrofolate cyclo-ligase [Lysobacter sp. Root494]